MYRNTERPTHQWKILRAAIEAAVDRGETLATIEEEIIDPLPLPEDAKSALWLYAWAAIPGESRASAVSSLIEAVGEG